MRSTGDRGGEICTLCSLGNCYRAVGQLDDALENYSLVSLKDLHSLQNFPEHVSVTVIHINCD